MGISHRTSVKEVYNFYFGFFLTFLFSINFSENIEKKRFFCYCGNTNFNLDPRIQLYSKEVQGEKSFPII